MDGLRGVLGGLRKMACDDQKPGIVTRDPVPRRLAADVGLRLAGLCISWHHLRF
jgi:hypothetical protein